MDELERLLEEYIRAEGSSGRTISVKEMRNAAGPSLVEKGMPVSEVLRGIAAFVKDKVSEGRLLRERPGVYSYWLDGVPSTLQASDSQRKVLSQARALAFDGTDIRPSTFSAFESVASLAASDQFLIKRDIKQVDLLALQGISL